MIRFKAYRFTPQALAQARAMGVYGDTATRLGRMLKRSAPFTSPIGNRRFQDYAFMTEGDLVVWVARLDQTDEAA